MRRFLMRWHCGWCQPLSRWQLALYPAGIRWTTGICASCLEQERAKRRQRYTG